MPNPRNRGKIIHDIIGFQPTPEPAWTWWDHLVYRTTRHVSTRVLTNRMAMVREDERRLRILKRELERASA